MQEINKPTDESNAEFKANCPLEINKRYIVQGYRLHVSIKTRNILSISAYPTQVLREEMLKEKIRPITVNVEVYRKALVEFGLFQAMENKYRKAKFSAPNKKSSYKLAKELLLKAATQNIL
jgi:hypothetical protein